MDEEGVDDPSSSSSALSDFDQLTSELDSLTGRPVAEDSLLYVLPTCAPYSSLNDYKYKIKLLPGTGKRGKGGKAAQQYFLQQALTPIEKEMIRAIPDNDFLQVMLSDIKLNAPGLQESKGGKKKK